MKSEHLLTTNYALAISKQNQGCGKRFKSAVSTVPPFPIQENDENSRSETMELTLRLSIWHFDSFSWSYQCTRLWIFSVIDRAAAKIHNWWGRFHFGFHTVSRHPGNKKCRILCANGICVMCWGPWLVKVARSPADTKVSSTLMLSHKCGWPESVYNDSEGSPVLHHFTCSRM